MQTGCFFHDCCAPPCPLCTHSPDAPPEHPILASPHSAPGLCSVGESGYNWNRSLWMLGGTLGLGLGFTSLPLTGWPVVQP